MNEFSIISPAMFNLYNDCENKFYYQYIEQVSAPVLEENFLEGKNIHNLVSYYLRGNSVEKYEAGLSEKELVYWKNLKKSPFLKYEVVGIEKSLSMRIDDYWIGGRLDAIVKDKNDYFILDYKTGGVGADKTFDYQTMVYSLLCDEFYKDRSSLTFVYLDLKNDKEVKIAFSKDLKEEYLERIRTACTGMRELCVGSKTVCTDLNCSYSKLCRVAGY